MAPTAERADTPAIDGMTREQVAALSPAERERRRLRLLCRPGVLTMKDLARASGLSINHIYRMRMDFLANGGIVTPNTLPVPDPEVNSPDLRQPGDDASKRGPSPVWLHSTALPWLAWALRSDEDYVPNRRGRLASGRPPRQRVESATPSVTWEEYLSAVKAEVAAYRQQEQGAAA